MLKAVVHIDYADTDRQKNGLRNVQNVLSDATTEVDLCVVCHGAGISLLVAENNPNATKVAELIQRQVQFLACENTLESKSLSMEDLVAGVQRVPSGAIEVITRQHQGYAYFRP